MDYKTAVEILKREEAQVHEQNMKEALNLAIELMEVKISEQEESNSEIKIGSISRYWFDIEF